MNTDSRPLIRIRTQRAVDFRRTPPKPLRTHRNPTSMLMLLLLFISETGVAQDLVIDVIQLRNRPASEMVDLVAPFVGRYGTVVPSGSKLIVKTSPANLEQIHALVDKLDKGLAQYQISVLQTRRRTLEELNAGVSVYGVAGNRGSAVVAGGNLYQTDSKRDGETTQTIRTLEGKAAHIEVGEAIPVPEVSGYGNYGYPAAGIRYQPATTGFAVTPRQAGNRSVILEVAPWSDRLDRRGGGVIQTQSAQTTIRAPLGQWVNFGGQNDRASGSSDRLLGHSYGNRKQQMNIFIKVDKVR